ncbi:MAG: hypothetical protein ABIG95_00955 [Candidatus Woesearchaeota archaeon]
MKSKRNSEQCEKKPHLKKIKSMGWQEYGLIALLITVLILHFVIYSPLKHLPGPIYGGDVYRNRAFVMNMLNGNPPWTDMYFLNASAYREWGVFLIVAATVRIFNANVDRVMIFFSVFIPLLIIISGYLLGEFIFKSKTWALLLSFVYLSYWGITSNLIEFTMPLILFSILFWLKLEADNRLRYAVLTGIFFGLFFFVRSSEGLLLVLLFALTVILTLFRDFFTKKDIRVIISYLKKYWAVPFFTLLLSLPLILPMYLYHRFHIVNPTLQYSEVGVTHLGVSWVISGLFKTFFNTISPSGFIMGLFALLGLITCIIKRGKMPRKFLLLWFIFIPLLALHHLITRPLLGFWVLPGKLFNFGFLIPIFVVYGAGAIYSNINHKYKLIFLIIFLFAVPVPLLINKISNTYEDQWYKYGLQMDSHTYGMYSLGDWVRENVGNDEAILSNDEDGFALAGLSGKKVLVARKTHVSYYVDINQRIADAAVIMYGNNSPLREELIEGYSLKYFYLGAMLFQSPMRVPVSFKEYLASNDVAFVVARERLDIAVEKAEFFDLAIIPPQNLSTDFLSRLEGVADFNEAGKVFTIKAS